MKRRLVRGSLVGLGVVTLATLWLGRPVATQGGGRIAIDSDDLAGVVTGPKGPEAGVWVIAETKDLPVGVRKIVVTDDQGRYLVPDLPRGSYSVFVRGYGLVDSPRVQAKPGQLLNLRATVAPTPQAAAHYYPPNYWLSLLKIPDKSEFPGTGDKGNGIGEAMKTQHDWISIIKNECEQCHSLGDKATREIPPSLANIKSTVAAWDRRVQSGQQGAYMNTQVNHLGRKRALDLFADWTDRVKGGEVPPAPPRPQGLERNIVLTQWDGYGDQYAYIHDLIATDRRNPTINANGPVYNVDRYNNPDIYELDPVKNTVTPSFETPPGDPALGFQTAQKMPQPSPYWGDKLIWTNKVNVHNLILDREKRLWMTTTWRPGNKQPAFCQTHPSAKAFPTKGNGRQVSMFDPKTGKVTYINTCFGTHHLFFAEDADDTLWFSGGGNAVGYLKTKQYLQTGDEAASQGWIPFVVDTNGNGKRDDGWAQPNEPIDPAKDKRFGGSGGGAEGGFSLGFYGVMPNPVDGSVWGAVLYVPGAIVRVDPKTLLAEIYELPLNNPKFKGPPSYTPRGIDVDRNGVVWAGVASGHLASFDRRKCKVVNGPTATGQHCPEGWTLHQIPGPQFKGVTDPGSADFQYYNWVDQFDTFGLGKNTAFGMGSTSDSLLALHDGKFLTIRVPYPMGFYAKGADGRIDDPKAGWKGKGLWGVYSALTPWHFEGGEVPAASESAGEVSPG